MITRCTSCNSDSIFEFYQVDNVPVNSVLLMSSKQEALSYPKGNIVLGFCRSCGFIFNMAFEPELLEYSSRYEETQGFSPTFNKFHRKLAIDLIEKHDLHHKTILEIGCGKGDFLNIICALGDNAGIGFDPAFIDERSLANGSTNVRFIKDFYSEEYANITGDFVCCKMTLEHIINAADFVKMVRRSVNSSEDPVIFFQVPNAANVLQKIAFWDVYYEHCSYFSLGSLARLFRAAKFDVISLTSAYDNQYIMIDAKPRDDSPCEPLPQEEEVQELGHLVERFQKRQHDSIRNWRTKILSAHEQGKKVVIWGGGSKGVAFLTTMGITDEIQYAVDINPHKHGTFLPGNGQETIGPQSLAEYQPDMVIVMNPIYCAEVSTMVSEMGLTPEIIPLEN